MFDENCYNSVIFNNTLFDCVIHGIRVHENNTGVILSTNYLIGIVSYKHGLYIESDDVTIRYNTIQGCDYGIYLPDANGCTIHNNTVFGNNIGINIDPDSSSNTLYYNILYGNSQVNAKDDGTYNIWDDGVSVGNYWGNLDTPGEYVIPGFTGSVDRYAQPYHPPISTPPPPVRFILVSAGVVGAAVAVVCLRRR